MKDSTNIICAGSQDDCYAFLVKGLETRKIPVNYAFLCNKNYIITFSVINSCDAKKGELYYANN